MPFVLERLTAAQNDHDVDRFASCFAEDYVSEQPVHPGRRFTGRVQVHDNWSAIFAGVPDFHAELVAVCREDDEEEWGEVSWRGHHVDGSVFAMRGVIIASIRDDRIAAARLYVERVEPVETVEQDGAGIDAAVEELSRPPGDS